MKKQIFEIEWHDAFTYDSCQKIDSMIAELKKGNIQKTIGYLIGENKDWIALAATLSEEDRVTSTWFIPKKWIVKRTSFSK